MAGETILLVDDEANIVQLARLYLEREGFRVESAGDGRAALEGASRWKPALIVLDLMLPELDGLEVCRRLRAQNDPAAILMLTARDEDVDKILGLEMGADDYLTKPFNPRELVARVKAILRRAGCLPAVQGARLYLGDVVVDPPRRLVLTGDRQVELRAQEFDLLAVLASSPELVFSREKLLELAWGYDYFGQTRTVDVHIGHLRKKLTGTRVSIETVTGIGYKLVVE